MIGPHDILDRIAETKVHMLGDPYNLNSAWVLRVVAWAVDGIRHVDYSIG